jgi:uncharacterized protein YwqG
MKYYVPKLKRAQTDDSQTEPKEKFGGLPFGLPAERYPICAQCANPLALLVQFVHDPERLDLGREGRGLFVFQCNNGGTCQTWDDESGANACLVIEPEDLTSRTEKVPDGKFEPEKAFRITNWQEHDDEIAPEISRAFYSEREYYNLDDDVFDELYKKITAVTRLGGTPFWIQYPEIPKGGWKLVGQLDDHTGFNFGDAGMGYIFIEEREDPAQLPKGRFLWQCH